MMSGRAFLGLVAGMLLTGSALAAENLDEQVREMVRAARQMDYQGVLVHGMPIGVESVRFYHAGESDGAYRERLVMLTGPARELVRNGESVRRYHPEKGRVLVGPHRAGTAIFRLDAGDLERVRDHYGIERGPAGRVAGRQARAILFRAGDDERFTYRVWQDKKTSLPLQTEVIDQEGQVQETFMFATVEVGGEPRPSDLELGAPSEVPVVERRRLEEGKEPEVLGSLELPPGFRLQARYQGAQGEGGSQYFYSDGLATLSVFLERDEKAAGTGEESRGIHQRGALHASSLASGGYRITLLGELPGPALRRIAESLDEAGEEDGE